MRVPAGGASCLGEGRPGSGALPPPTAPGCGFGRAAGLLCVCVPCLAGSGGPASRARFGAPHLSFGLSCFALCLFGPLRAGVPLFVVVVGFFFFWLLFPFSPLLRPRCVLLCVFSGPGCLGPWRLVPPPFFVSPPPPSVRPVVSCFACFPAWGALGLGVLPPPPLFLFWFFLPPPLLSLVFLAFRLPFASAPPPLFFFLSFLSCCFFSCCASAVCVLGCRAVCSLSCPFVVLCASSVLFLVAGVVGSWCRCLLLGVRRWLWLPGGFVWLWCPCLVWPSLGVLPAVSRSPVLCPVARCCRVVLCCGALSSVFFFSPCWWPWFPVVPRWFWAPGRFRVVFVSVLCLCGAVLVCLCRCSLSLAGLAGVLCCCLLCLCVCCWAWLSSVVSWWLLLSCLGSLLWCVPGCCAAPCCCALCRLALRCCALCCFVLLRLVLLRALLCPGALSFVLGSCAFWRRVLSCPPALCVFCCGVSLRGVVRRCASCRVRPGVSCCAFLGVSALCGVAVWPTPPRCPASLCCAPWCCAAAWCCGVLSCRLVGFVSCVGVVVPT